MPGTVVIGAQWGDEAKAKIVDYFACDAAAVVRYQGGANAGHTVVVGDEKFVFHALPSGILHDDCLAIVSTGVMLDVEALCKEIRDISARGINLGDRVRISESAQVVMPYHKLLDEAHEKMLGPKAVGTTKRGIGPANADKYGRKGLRMRDVLDPDMFRSKVAAALQEKNVLFRHLYKMPEMSVDSVVEQLQPSIDALRPYVCNTVVEINALLDAGEHVLFEGAQGAMLDIEHGSYPYCTSSHTIAGAATVGAGVGAGRLNRIVGVYKAYTTRVGNGPMPTELDDPTGTMLQDVGQEFGATTGRPRRCGWFDGVVAQHVARISGLTDIVVSKLDVLDDFDEIKVCVAYECRGERIDYVPGQAEMLADCVPVYETFPGWKSSTRDVRAVEDLPPNARSYLEALEQIVGCPISHIGVGPGRAQIVSMKEVTPAA